MGAAPCNGVRWPSLFPDLYFRQVPSPPALQFLMRAYEGKVDLRAPNPGT